MNKLSIVLIFAVVVVASVVASDDYYEEPQKKINVYIEKQQPELKKTIVEYRPKVIVKEYRKPEVKIIKKVEYKQPEKKIYVNVLKEREQRYVLKPDYDYKH